MILFDDDESATRKKASRSRRRKYLFTALGTVGSLVTIVTAVLKLPQVDLGRWLSRPRPLFQLDPRIKGITVPTERSLQFKYTDSQSTLGYFLSYRNSSNPEAQDIAERCLRKVLHDERANAPKVTMAYLLALYGQYNLRGGHRPAGIQQLEEAARLSRTDHLLKALLLQAYEEANRDLEAMPTPWPAPIQEQIHGYRLKIDALRQELRPFLAALAGPSSSSGCTLFRDQRACGSAAPCKRCTDRGRTEIGESLVTRRDSLALATLFDFRLTNEAKGYGDFVPLRSADTPDLGRVHFSLEPLSLEAAFDTIGIDDALLHFIGYGGEERSMAALGVSHYRLPFALHGFLHSSQRVVQDHPVDRYRLPFERRLAQVGRLERVDLTATAPYVASARDNDLWSFTFAWAPQLLPGESLRAVADAPVQVALPGAELLPRLGNSALAFWPLDGNPDVDCSWTVNGVCASAFGDGGHSVLSVGINAYDAVQSGFEPLAYARSDAEKLSQAFGRLGYSATTLVDQGASREKILDALAREALASRPGDDFVFYFSGHGFSDANGRGALVTASADAAPVGVVSLAEVAQILSFHRGTTTVIVDGCLNNLNVMLDGGTAAIGYGPNHTRFIAAAGGQALESQRLKAGLYAYALLDFLNHQAVVHTEDSRHYRLDFDTLLAATSTETARLARDLYGLEQRPRRLDPPGTVLGWR